MSTFNAAVRLGQARIKARPEHFCVHEVLDRAFSGEGEHAYFLVEKTSLNTTDVVAMLAADFQVPPQTVGYAGRKDKHAVTRQWFSVPTPQENWLPQDARVKVLCRGRSEKKLRRGDHSANRFELTLTQVRDCDAAMAQALSGCFPNYFGPQRLSAENVRQAQDWLRSGGWGRDARDQPRGARRRAQKQNQGRRGWHLSVLRSLLFNAVLEQRVAAGNYASLIDGDIAIQAMPSGPLWGRGRSQVSGLAAQIESRALSVYADICEALEYAGVSMQRRALAVQPQQLQMVQTAADEWVLQFTLPPGVYATALLANHFTLHDASAYHE
ncbi:MAG: tRNA pseudouridine(13) synthase TruD [bacterium]